MNLNFSDSKNEINKNYPRIKKEKQKNISKLYKLLDSGWVLEFHSSKEPLRFMRMGLLMDSSCPYTAISPEGNFYHGNHNQIIHNKYTISQGGYQDFIGEPLCDDFSKEIKRAFEIFSYVNIMGLYKSQELVEKINNIKSRLD